MLNISGRVVYFCSETTRRVGQKGSWAYYWIACGKLSFIYLKKKNRKEQKKICFTIFWKQMQHQCCCKRESVQKAKLCLKLGYFTEQNAIFILNSVYHVLCSLCFKNCRRETFFIKLLKDNLSHSKLIVKLCLRLAIIKLHFILFFYCFLSYNFL